MPVRSEVGRGLIYAGDTPLASSVTVEQGGPFELVIHPGIFTTTGVTIGGRCVIPAHSVNIPGVTITVRPGHVYHVDIGSAGVLVWEDGSPTAGAGSTIHPLVYPFRTPEHGLDGVTVFVLEVRPGFPPGTTAADWRMQGGRVSA